MKVLAVAAVLAVLPGVESSPDDRSGTPATAASPVGGALWPVDGTIVRRFIAPACEKCRGPRGVTFEVAAGSVVRAAVDAEVSFVGQVSRRRYVVQRLGNGVLLTYGWLAGTAPGVVRGAPVARGTVLGTTGSTFYLGARVHGRYVDPLVLLGFGRVRLVGPGSIGRTGRSR